MHTPIERATDNCLVGVSIFLSSRGIYRYLGWSEDALPNIHPVLGPCAPQEHLERSRNLPRVGEPQAPGSVHEALRRAPHDGVLVWLYDRADTGGGNSHLGLAHILLTVVRYILYVALPETSQAPVFAVFTSA